MLQKITSTKFLNYFFIFLGLAFTFFLSFQYFFLADFPIGQDFINHLASTLKIEKLGFIFAFKASVYPFSLIILVLWQKLLGIFGFSYEKTFIFAECFHLFLVAIFSGFLSYKIFKDLRIAILTSLFVASSRWLNEGLRIGLFAEILGWLFFVISLIFVFDKKWIPLVVSMIFEFFIHPLAFFALIFVISGFFIYWFIKEKRREKIKALFFVLVCIFVFALIYLLIPDIFTRIKFLVKPFFSLGTNRSIIDYAIDSEKRRILFYSFAFFGLISLLFSNFNKEKKWLVFIFAFISFWFCFAHIFGLRYLDFRVYGYFEIASAILSAYAVVEFSQWILSKKLSLLISLPLAFFLIYPNWLATKSITIWQLNDYSVGHVTPPAERKLFREISGLLKPKAKICGFNIWSLWFKIYDFQVFDCWERDFSLANNDEEILKAKKFLTKHKIDYIYFSSIDSERKIEKADFLKKIYDKDNIRVYEVKKY